MFLKPFVTIHSGIYIKEDPIVKSQVEMFELRPDMLVSWSVVDVSGENYLGDLLFRGNWSVGADRLLLDLIDDDDTDIIQLQFYWREEKWVSENDQNVWLRKRGGMEEIEGPFYFDHR